MDSIQAVFPSVERGYLPLYLFVVSTVAMANVVQSFTTLHYSRRVYNGRFVPNASLPKASSGYDPEDSASKLTAVEPSAANFGLAKDQMIPLAARLFGTYTFIAGLIRFYACYRLEDPYLYQLALWTHIVAVSHYTSELLVFKTLRFSGAPQAFPLAAGYVGTVWMLLQWSHYVES